MIWFTFTSEAVLISGGKSQRTEKSAELFHLLTKKRCSLPNLPLEKYFHTSVGGVLCGGGKTGKSLTTCISLDPTTKKWSSKKYQRIRIRDKAVSWKWKDVFFKNSFAILGGGSIVPFNDKFSSLKNIDVVFDNGTVVHGFEDLKYSIQ